MGFTHESCDVALSLVAKSLYLRLENNESVLKFSFKKKLLDMRKILIANRGLSAIKFLVSMREHYTPEQIWLVGLASPDDLRSGYRYIDLVAPICT